VTAEGDAQTAIDGFAAKGFPGAFLIKGGGRFRIALKAYHTEADAYAKVNELKQNALFKDAWVLKTKKLRQMMQIQFLICLHQQHKITDCILKDQNSICLITKRR